MTWVFLGLLCLQEGSPARLIDLLRSDSVNDRERAHQELVGLGDAARPELERATEDPDFEVSSRARQALRSIGIRARFSAPLENALPQVVDSIERGDSTWTQAFYVAAQGLSSPSVTYTNRDVARLAVTILRDGVRSDEKAGVCDSIASLKLPVPASEISGLLLASDPRLVCSAITALRALGAREAVPAIVRKVPSTCVEVSETAVAAVRALGPAEAVPLLANQLDTVGGWERQRVTALLGEWGDRRAIPALRRRLRDEDRDVREAAAVALGRLKAEEAVAEVISILKEGNQETKVKVLRALEGIGSREAVPAILELLEDERVVLRQAALQALGKLGAVETVPAIVKLLEDRLTCQSALYALGLLRAREAEPQIRLYLEDRDSYIRGQAADTLRRIGTRDR